MRYRTSKFLIAILLIASGSMSMAGTASAHQSGCHTWHSCPSDTGAYVCGDLGHYSECPVTVSPAVQYVPPTVQYVPTSLRYNQPFIGVPRTRKQLLNCAVVGNNRSHIYHFKGSSYIRQMTVSGKHCFLDAEDAEDAGFRASMR